MSAIVLCNGRVISFDNAPTVDADIRIEDGRIAAIGPGLAPDGAHVVDLAGALVTPALTDIHTHIYWGGTSLGVRPEKVALRSATGVFVDAGSAGAGNIAGLDAFILRPAPFHGFAYLNVSFAGIFGFSRNVMVGECADFRLVDKESCIEAAREHKDIVVGIKVRAGKMAAGENGAAALEAGLEIAAELELPVMCHVDFSPPDIDHVLEHLRSGDILTHCCRPDPNAATTDGHVRDAAWKACERGVHFDIGHGMGGFSFQVCREMLADGFVPDLISSDIHALSIDGPAFDLLTTINKLIALGVEAETALAAASATPAAVLRRPALGRIRQGEEANLAMLRWQDGPYLLRDATGEPLDAERRLVCDALIVKGRMITPDGRALTLNNLQIQE